MGEIIVGGFVFGSNLEGEAFPTRTNSPWLLVYKGGALTSISCPSASTFVAVRPIRLTRTS
jgi:hypothetical protein